MKSRKFQFNIDKRGIATLEMLIAMALIVGAISTVMLLVFSGQSSTVSSQTNQEALYKAKQALESARAAARADFGSLASTGPVSDNIYTKTTTVENIDAYTKKVTSEVSWGAGFKIDLSTLVSDWFASGGICNPNVSGDWTQPERYGYVDFPSSTGATGVDVKKGIAYVVSNPSSSSSNDFYAIDVTDPNLKPLPVLGRLSSTLGLNDVYTLGSYSYAAANSAAFQLLTIDVSDPVLLSASKIVSKKDVTLAGDTAVGNTIFYANKKIYLGLTLSTGKEFHVFDVSNPSSPVEIGPGYEVGSAINKIIVRSNIAYLATAGNKEIIALDVSGTTPTLLGSYASITLTGQSLALDKFNTLYFGRIGGSGNPKLLAFDIANLSTPKWTMNMSTQSGIYTETLRNNLLFMTTADPNDGLQIWNIAGANSTTSPIRYDTSPLNIQQGATSGSSCVGNLLYVAQRSNRALQIVGPHVSAPASQFDYTLTNSGNTSTNQGGTVNVVITDILVAGSTKPVTLSVSGISSSDHINTTFTNNPCSSTCASTLKLQTSASSPKTPKGTYLITVTGAPTGAGLRTTSFNLTVN